MILVSPSSTGLGHDWRASHRHRTSLALAIAGGDDVEVGAVQMHRVERRREVDEPEAHVVAGAIRQPLGGTATTCRSV